MDGFENEKSSILAKYTENFIFIIKTKSNPSTSVFTFSNISHILKTKFYICPKISAKKILYFGKILGETDFINLVSCTG